MGTSAAAAPWPGYRCAHRECPSPTLISAASVTLSLPLSSLPCPRGLSRSHSISFLCIAMTPSALLHFLDASLIEMLSSCPHVTLALPLSLPLWPSGLHYGWSHTLQAKPWFSGTQLLALPCLHLLLASKLKLPTPQISSGPPTWDRPTEAGISVSASQPCS